MPYRFQGGAGCFAAAKTPNQFRSLCSILSRAEDEDDLKLLAIQQFERNADGRAWVQSRAELSGQPCLVHSGWVRQYPVAAHKLCPVCGDRCRSEERRVGKEWRARWTFDHVKQKNVFRFEFNSEWC